MQRRIGLIISQEREIAPTDIAANKDIAAKTTTTDATADARHRNVLMVLMVPTIKKTRPSKDIQPMTRTAIRFSNETYTQFSGV